MDLVQLDIKGISYSQTQTGAYALLLSEIEGDRQLPIVIGAFEAQSIAIALEKDIKPPRPLTHDLFKNFSDSFDITVQKVIIHKLVDGIFYASLVCKKGKKEETIDARTSDAIALALRFKAPIFTYKNILDKAGIQLKGSTTSKQSEPQKSKAETEIKSAFDLKNLSLKDLKKLLEDAVQNEEYEKAAQIRDEMSKRS
ncbi:bifunctional nuclease family protein [Flavobacteriaceae bacterium 14752]|uniref:bifunctional nuclease family protein n=1 Tax=Mesohalobacter salilacus TaxID=2491711 RepID=UPI000F641CC7|nr:bifunctional nuclease family protein [Flavobacteriaceae bacterium 14752]